MRPFFHRAPALLLAMLPAAAHCQSETTALSSGAPQGEEVVVTATRFEQPARDVPVGMIVITDEQIRRSGVSTLPQLLSSQPGITVRDNSGSPDQSVDLRGFGITGDQNTLVLVDGQRLSENELSTARFSTIPLSAIDRIEILRGSGAVLYGANATGGVINIITKTPRAGDRDFNLFGGYGTYDTLDLRTGGSIASDRVGFTINGGHYSSDNYRDHNRVQQRNVEAALQTIGSGPLFGLKFGADDQDLQLPGVRNAAQLESDRRGATTPSDFSNRNGFHTLLTSLFDIGFGTLAADLGYRRKDVHSSTELGGSIIARNDLVNTYSASPRLKVAHPFFGAQGTLITGVDFEYWDYDSLRDASPFTNAAHVTAIQRNVGIYLQDAAEFQTGTVLSAGGRWEQTYGRAQDSDSNAPTASGNQTRRVTAYEVALRQNLPAALAAYAKVGRSFRIATLDEIYNQFAFPAPIVAFLEPQTADNHEVGLELKKDDLFMRAAVYYMTLENEIHFNPVTFNNINLPPTRRYGIELESSWRALRWLELAANYTLAVAQFRSGQLSGIDVAGKTVPLVPRNKFTLSGNVDLGPDTRLNAVFSYVGSQFFDNDETNSFGRKIPAYRVFDLKISHRIKQWILSAAASNLFNEKYFDYGARSLTSPNFSAYPQPEQALFFSVEYRTR